MEPAEPVSGHRLRNALIGRKTGNRLRETFPLSRTRATRVSRPRHLDVMAGVERTRTQVSLASTDALLDPLKVRAGVCGRRARIAKSRKRLSRMSSHPPPMWRTDGSPMGHPLHPPTRTGVVPLARRRRRHHDVRPRAVRPRRSVPRFPLGARVGSSETLPTLPLANVRGRLERRARPILERFSAFRLARSRSLPRGPHTRQHSTTPG